MEQAHGLPLSAFCCQNPRCADYGKKGSGNLYQHNWVDRRRKRIRNLRCRTCKKEFSERKGTPWYQAKLSEAKAVAIAQHLAEGDGLRKTARLVGSPLATVIHWNRKLGEHGKALHEEQVRHVKVREAQGDEMWSFVGKKRRPLRPHRPRG
jgi:transposase-like protein